MLREVTSEIHSRFPAFVEVFLGYVVAGGEAGFLPPPKIQFGTMGQTLLQTLTSPWGYFGINSGVAFNFG